MRCTPLIRLLVCALLATTLTACAYHGRIRRGLYIPGGTTQKADKSLLVISDKGIPDKIAITDPSNTSFYDFTLDVADGTAVAVTDMLAQFVTRADAGTSALENRYDFAVDVKLSGELTRSNCASELKNLAARQNGLCTQLMLTIRRSGKPDVLTALSARRWSPFDKPSTATVLRWINEHTLYLLSPIFLPAYTQLQGAQLRRQFETHLQEMLDEMSQTLRAQPEVFNLPDAPTR